MDIRNTIGQSIQRPVGELRAPTPEERGWINTIAQPKTGVPKDALPHIATTETNATREKWDADLAIGGKSHTKLRSIFVRLQGAATGA